MKFSSLALYGSFSMSYLVFGMGCYVDPPEPNYETETPLYVTSPPAVSAAVENEAWEGTLYHQSYTGTPTEDDVQGNIDMEIHIFEYNKGYFCGRTRRIDSAAARYECKNGNCEWKDRSGSIDEPTGFSLTYGVITIAQNGHADICGWLPVDPEERDVTPVDPNSWPSDTVFSCDDSVNPAHYTGYIDLNAGNPSDVLYQYDAAEFTPPPSGDPIDFGPEDLQSRSVSPSDESGQARFCGDWIKSL